MGMMTVHDRRTATAIATLALLTGCGGGGGTGSGAGGVASTPVPPSGPTYTALANATASTPLVSRAVHYTPAADKTTRIDIRYDSGTATYTVRGVPAGGSAAIEQSFGPSEQSSNGRYVRPANGSAPAASLSVSAGLTYANFGSWTTRTGTGTTELIDTVVFAAGVPTLASDMPRTGSATYDLALYGDPNGPPLEGKGSIRADFAAATVDVMLAPLFRYRPVGIQNDDPFTTLTGTWAISTADGTAAFAAQLTSSNGYTGSIEGAFYGPQAAEVGAAFTIINPVGGPFDGAVLGRKN